MRTLKPLALLASLLALAGCPKAPEPDPIPPSPTIASFKATPAQVVKGSTTILSWEVSDATSVTIVDAARGAVSGVDNKLSGTVQVQVDASALFVLSATNDRGAKATAVATVSVGGPSQLLFLAYPAVIPAGQKGSLVWSAPGAHAVTITPRGGAALDLGGQLESGTVAIDPTDTETTYTLNADGATRDLTVQRGAGIADFTTSKRLAAVADTVTFTWHTTNAQRLVLSTAGRPALLDTMDAARIASGTFDDVIPTVPAGTVLTWDLAVDGKDGTSHATVQVAVGTAPVVLTLTAPEYAKIGGTFTLAWTTAGADVVQVSDGASVIYQTVTAPAAASGSLALATPAADTTYTVSAVNSASGEQGSKAALVKPVGAASVTSFTATPATVASGGTPVTLAWNVPGARRLRVTTSEGFTVVSATGPTAETGTVNAYPNGAATYTLEADNTLDPLVTATAGPIAVTTPTLLRGADGGIVFGALTQVDLGWSVGGSVYGLGHEQVDVQATSTGFDDISTTGRKLNFTSRDDSTLSFTPRWYETYLYGTRVSSTVVVSTNGFLVFGSSASSRPTPTTFPNTALERNFVAPLWMDLVLGSGDIYWQVKGDAPEQVLIVQWTHVQQKNQPGTDLTFEAKVHQTGVVTFEYQALNPVMASPVIGVQGAPGVGLSSPSAPSGGGITFFGPKPSPLTLRGGLLPATGFVKVGAGYLRAQVTFIAAADLSISEVMARPAAAVDAGQWLEVANESAVPLDLGGWTLDWGDGLTHTIGGSLALPAKSRVVIAQSSDPAENDGVTASYATNFQVPVDGGTVSLQLGGAPVASARWDSLDGGSGVATVYDSARLLSRTGVAPTLICPATRAYGSQVPPQLGTPGTDSSCYGYRLTTIPGSFLDITDGGTKLSASGDDATSTFTPAVPTPVFGTTAATLSACTNGWLSAASTTATAYLNSSLPAENSEPTAGAFLAPFWDDLTIAAPAGIWWKRIAAGEDPNNPAPHLVVEWKGVTRRNQTDDLNFELKVFDDGTIEYHYGVMSGSDGSGATVWLVNPGATLALPYSINQPLITPSSAIRFTRLP